MACPCACEHALVASSPHQMSLRSRSELLFCCRCLFLRRKKAPNKPKNFATRAPETLAEDTYLEFGAQIAIIAVVRAVAEERLAHVCQNIVGKLCGRRCEQSEWYY